MGTTIIPAGKENEPHYYVPPYDKEVELQPNFFCRARNVKREKYCRARAGQGTDHLGQGRCKNHGGMVPIVHGRYSEVVRGNLGEHLDRLELEDDKERLDVLPEATLLRGLTMDAAERWTEFHEAIIAWNKAEAAECAESGKRPKFINVPDITSLAELAKKTAEIVNMVHKQRSANAISMSDFLRLMTAMAQVVMEESEKTLKGRIPQQKIDEFLNGIQEKWRTIKIKNK